MGFNPGILSITSCIFGLVLSLVSMWLLYTVMSEQPEDEYKNNRPSILNWASAAGIGTCVGVYQFIFSIAYSFQMLSTSQQTSSCWNLSHVTLHTIFLIALLWSLIVGFKSDIFSMKEGKTVGAAFYILEIVDSIFIVIVLSIYEINSKFCTKLVSYFSMEEARSNLFSYGRRGPRRERLINETSFGSSPC